MKSIRTGADKLIDLISKYKRIKTSKAAKDLGVSEDTVQEWAEFLEQEGRILIHYGFFGVTLTKLEGTKEEVIEAGKKLVSEKDAFRRKIDATLNKLSQETTDFEEIKKQYKKIHSQIRNEINSVKQDVDELTKFENLKNNLDKEILKQKKTYENDSKIIKKGIDAQAQKFDFIIKNIDLEKKELEKTQSEVKDVYKKRNELHDLIAESEKLLVKLKNQSVDVENHIKTKENEVLNIQKKLNILKQEVQTEKEKSVVKLSNWVEKDTERIQKEQEELLQNAKQKTKEIQSHKTKGDDIHKSFKSFFDKKIKAEKDIEFIEKESKELESNLLSLKKKITSFRSMKSNKELQNFEREIQKEIDGFEKKRKKITSRIGSFMEKIK